MRRKGRKAGFCGREAWWEKLRVGVADLLFWSTDNVALRQRLYGVMSRITDDVGTGVVIHVRGGGGILTLKRYPNGVFACCENFVTCCDTATEGEMQKIMEKLKELREEFDIEIRVI